jgi:hypothetical protein
MRDGESNQSKGDEKKRARGKSSRALKSIFKCYHCGTDREREGKLALETLRCHERKRMAWIKTPHITH